MKIVENPIIIVGAGRSGTKLLRQCLGVHPDLVSLPREVNYLWRYGNATYKTDQLLPEHARPEVITHIRKKFGDFSARHGGRRLIEKTCANALRLDFVHTVFPKAVFIHIVRDGRAVAESARRCWAAPVRLAYVWEKLRWVPIPDMPYYCLRYLKYQLGRVRSAERGQSSWGPRFNGLDAIVRDHPLIDACALQWKTCVRAVESSFECLDVRQKVTVRYEDLVTDPVFVIQDVLCKLHMTMTDGMEDYLSRNVKREHMDKWKTTLSIQDVARVKEIAGKDLIRLGYIA